jgi:Zn-dependent peptidase ImmA (M78 family)
MATILSELRDLAPSPDLGLPEALVTADVQADALLRLTAVIRAPVPDRVIIDLPRVQVERVDLGETAGAAQWSLGRWVILLNRRNVVGRQRFSLFHEFKHVIDHDADRPAIRGTRRPHAEQICDYFAGCALMPRSWLEAAWYSGRTDVAGLAREFRVSLAAMRVRLLQIGLIEADTVQPATLTNERRSA